MTELAAWRIGVDVRSPDVGAAAAFDRLRRDTGKLDVARVLSTHLRQDGDSTVLWIGAIVAAPSAGRAAAAAARIATLASTPTVSVAEMSVTVAPAAPGVSSDAGEDPDDLDEAADLASIPGATLPSRCLVRLAAAALADGLLVVRWSSGHSPLHSVTVEVRDDIVLVGVLEEYPPLVGADATGELLGRRRRRVGVRLATPLGAGIRLVDRYSGNELPIEPPPATLPRDVVSPSGHAAL